MVDAEPISQCAFTSEPLTKFIQRSVAGLKDLRESPHIEDVVVVVDRHQPALIINRQAGRGTRRGLADVGSLSCQ